MSETAPNGRGHRYRYQGILALLAWGLGATSVFAGDRDLSFAQVPHLPSGSTAAQEVVGAPEGGYEYRIGPEDVLEIQVRDNPDLSRSYQIRPDGRIAVPLIGDIEAVGLSTKELSARIAEALERFIRNPVVTVTVATAKGVFSDRVRLIGAGVTPQAVPYRDGLSVRSLLSEVGGLPPTAAGNRAHLLRIVNGREQRIALRLGDIATGKAADRPLLPGDVLVVPQGFFAGSFESSKSIGVAETYTDNLALAPKGREDGALISEIIPALSLNLDGARVTAAVNAEVRLQYYSQTALRDFSAAPNVTASSNWEWVEDLFFTDFSASIHRQTIDSRLARSASQSNIQNLDTVQVYRLSPYLVRDLGDIAQVEVRYVGALTFVDRSPLDQAGFPGPPTSLIGDSVQNTGELRIESGPRFFRLTWSLFGTISKIDPDGRPTRDRREAILRTEYHLTPSFALVAEGGYQNFEGSDFGRTVDDPLYLGGFRWTPSPNTRVEALGGQRDGGDAVEVELEHDVGETFTLSASYRERVRVGQERLVDNLPTSNELVGTFDPNSTLFTLFASPTRTKTGTAAISARLGRGTWRLTGSRQIQERDLSRGFNDEKAIRVRLQGTQPLGEAFAADLFGSYNRRRFADTGLPSRRTDNDYRASAAIRYLGLAPFAVSLRYAYSRRDSTDNIREFTENTIALDLSMHF